MTGRPGHWSEPGEYNILFLGSILVISSQDSSALGYREFTQEGAMTISPFAAREGTNAPQWPNVEKCSRHLVPSSDFFVQSYAVPIFGPGDCPARLQMRGSVRRLQRFKSDVSKPQSSFCLSRKGMAIKRGHESRRTVTIHW